MDNKRGKKAGGRKPRKPTIKQHTPQPKSADSVVPIPDSAIEIVDPAEIVEIAASPSSTENEKPQGFRDRLPPKTLFGKICWIGWEILTPLFWAYFFIKLFVFDIDSALFDRYLPEYKTALQYRSLFYLGVIVLFLVTLKKVRARRYFAFFIFYPLVILAWRIPKLLFRSKSWLIPFAVFNAIASFLRSIRYHLVMISLWIIAVVIALSMSNWIVLACSACVLLILISVSFGTSFISIFRRNSLYQFYGKLAAKADNWIRTKHSLTDDLKVPRTTFSNTQLETWTNRLELQLLFNRVTLFISRRLKEYHNSGLSIVGGIVSTIGLFLGTAFTFAVINFALFKIDAGNFLPSRPPTFFDFFYYSFNTLSFNSIDQLKPAEPISQAISMIENLFSVFLGAILLSLVISIKWQRTSAELATVIKLFEDEGKRMEQFISQQFEIPSAEDALAELNALKSNLIQILLYFTNHLR